jgi:hypothetical protein
MLSNEVLSQMSKCFSANKLYLSLGETNVIKFITKDSPQYPLDIGYNDKYIEEAVNTKFLGLQIDNHLNQKNHIDQWVPKLREACYEVRSVFNVSNIDTLKSVYFACFHCLMKYGIIFWGNSYDSKKAFTLQRKIVRPMMGVKSHNSCRELFKRLEILTLPCEYIFSLINFITNTVLINQLLTSHAFRKAYVMLG